MGLMKPWPASIWSFEAWVSNEGFAEVNNAEEDRISS